MRGWGLLVLSLHVLSCLVSGVASGRTSSYVRTEFPSTDIPLDSEWFAIPKGYNAPQQVSNFVTRFQLIISAIIVQSVYCLHHAGTRFISPKVTMMERQLLYLGLLQKNLGQVKCFMARRSNMTRKQKEQQRIIRFTITNLDTYTIALLMALR